MTIGRWIKVWLMLARLMWRYRGPLWTICVDAYNAVEKWAGEWKSAGESITSAEKKARAMRLVKAHANSTKSPYLRAKAAVHGEDTVEAVWATRNPRKARRRHGKAKG